MQQLDENITIITIFKVVYSKFFLILKLALIAQLPLAISLAFIQKDTYISEAIIKIEDISSSQTSSSIDLVALSGINLSGEGLVSDTNEISTSLEFFIFFLKDTDIPVQIMAAIPDGKNSWRINPNLYNQEKKEWIRKVKFPLKKEPSFQELHLNFNEFFSSSIDPRTDYLKIKVTHFSPEISYYWTSTFLNKLIEYTRQRDRKKSQLIINSYNSKLNTIQNKSISKDVAGILSQNYMNDIIADALPNYKFDILKQPLKPEFKENNNILKFITISFLIYFAISVIVFFIYFPKYKKELIST
jgi:hypothetical protein